MAELINQSEEVVQEGTPTPEQAQNEETPFALKVVYDQKEQELDQETATKYAQIGMNQEREIARRKEIEGSNVELKKKLDGINNSELMRFGKEFAGEHDGELEEVEIPGLERSSGGVVPSMRK